MVTILILGNALLVIFAAKMVYDRCKMIHATVETLKSELLSYRQQLAPLWFLPFVEEAKHLTVSEKFQSEQIHESWRRWTDQERKELEAFEKKAEDGEPFSPSTALKKTLKELNRQQRILEIVREEVKRFQSIYVDLMAGRLMFDDAEKKAKSLRTDTLFIYVDESDPELEKFWNNYASFWEAGKWRDHLKEHPTKWQTMH